MRPFAFESVPRVIFGAGAAARAGEVVARLGARRVLLVGDENLRRHARVVGESLAAADVACRMWAGGEAEPTTGVAERLVAAVADDRFDAVIGLGGGSNIDVAKAAAVLLRHGGALRDYAGQGRLPGAALPVAAIPTTAGSGSEVSGACILALPDDHSKLAIVDNRIRPAVTIVDPALHLSCPPAVTRDAGIDALCHAVEAFTIADSEAFPHDAADAWPIYQGKHPLTDVLAERAIELIGRNLAAAVERPDDLEARTRMALGALLAGVAMSNTGIYTVHALTYPVGAFTRASHGACNGALLPAVLDFVAPARGRELARVAELLGSPEATAGDAVRALLRRVGAAATLRELGLAREQIGPTAEIGHGIRRLMDGSPRPTSLADLRGIVERAYGDGP